METYICESTSVEFQLSEHQMGLWLGVDEMVGLDWAAADVPIVNALQNV
jgi:8-oxo-dGTP diphosphatase